MPPTFNIENPRNQDDSSGIVIHVIERNLSMKMRHVFQLINEFYAAFFASLAFSGGLIQTA